MANTAAKGNCYLCGKLLTKTTAKRHLLTHQFEGDKGQACMLVKIEAVYDKDYWLYVDIPLTSTLQVLDNFLRDIWLECCGHMSAFYYGRYEEVGFGKKISSIPEGAVMGYEYDFGSTTELKITFVCQTVRKKQQKAVRLLVRNEAPTYPCGVCGKPAEVVNTEQMYDEDGSPFYCEACAEKQELEEDYLLPVVNSPRMGVCGYAGEYDTYEFDPKKIKI